MLLVEICLGTSCHLMGAQDIADAIEAICFRTKGKASTCGASPACKLAAKDPTSE